MRFTDPDSMIIVSKNPHEPISLESTPTDKYGVGVAHWSVTAGTSISGTAADHMIGFICSAPVPTDNMMAGKRVYHKPGPGALCICPVGADYVAEFGGPVDGIMLRVSTECFALATSQLAAHGSTLVDRMDGYDHVLFGIAKRLEAEAAAGHPNGMLFWSTITDHLLQHLSNKYLLKENSHLRKQMHPLILKRIDTYISSNLAESIDLDILASVAGCERFRFARLFRHTVGVSPHRYVVRKRLDRALALLRAGGDSLADIAAATGFSDQSHLTNWVRRIYGTTPARLLTFH